MEYIEYKDYKITIANDPNSWNGIKSVEARKTFENEAFDYFYLTGIPLGNGRIASFQNLKEAEEFVREFIDKRTYNDIIHEHYHILINWNKKIEPPLTESRKAFELNNIDEAVEKVNEIGKLKVKMDERWRKSLLEHLKEYPNNTPDYFF